MLSGALGCQDRGRHGVAADGRMPTLGSFPSCAEACDGGKLDIELNDLYECVMGSCEAECDGEAREVGLGIHYNRPMR